jgi:hypothetical protein
MSLKFKHWGKALYACKCGPAPILVRTCVPSLFVPGIPVTEDGMVICNEILENACKNIIETILTCLEHATKGTVYRIGPIPALQAIRIASGIRKVGSDQIQWGLPAFSDYNYPGKSWEQYKDRPNHVLEAMAWCVEQQKSWTADNPYDDIRSVGKQLRGEIEDCHHMEPVLVRKADIYGKSHARLEYPKNWSGEPIWKDSEYVVVAVIKIHFLPFTLRSGDRSTKVIKELSRILGTELISLHLREILFQAHKSLTRQRLRSCEILAHELRNTITKLSFALSATNAQISILREEWEMRMRKALPELQWKDVILRDLCDMILSRLPLFEGRDHLALLANELLVEQEELARHPLLPDQGENWLRNRIEPKWERLLGETEVWSSDRDRIRNLIERLRKSLWIGTDEKYIRDVSVTPDSLKEKWLRFAYTYITADNISVLGDMLQFLDDPVLDIPHKLEIKKTLRSLKALLEVIPQVEERANRIILSLRNGSLSEDMEVEQSETINIPMENSSINLECEENPSALPEPLNTDWV